MGLVLMMPTAAFADDPVPTTTIIGQTPEVIPPALPGSATESVSVDYYDDNGNFIVSTPANTEPADSTGLVSNDAPDPGDSIQDLPDDSAATEPVYITTDSAMQGLINCGEGKVCGSPTYKGCATWHVWRTHRDDFGHVTFTFHVDVHFCWKAKHICTCPDALRVDTYLSDEDHVVQDRGNSQNDEYYYRYWSGVSNSGHASKVQRHIDYCLNWCYYTIYPWIHEYVHGDGTMYYHTGD